MKPLIIILLTAPLLVSAQFVPLVGLPGINGEMNFNTYLNALYALSISVAALLAVVKIIIAGVKWMLTDVVTSKSEAKKDIEGALIGLLVVVAAVLILTVINPNLVNFNLFNLDQAQYVEPQRAADVTRVTTPPRTTPGYRTISVNADQTTKTNFYLSCAGSVRTVGDEIRCDELSQAYQTSIEDNLPNATPLQTQKVIKELERWASSHIVTDNDSITTIESDPSVDEVYFMVRSPEGGDFTPSGGDINLPGGGAVETFEPGYETQIVSICNQFAAANGLPVSGPTDESYTLFGNGWIACAKPN